MDTKFNTVKPLPPDPQELLHMGLLLGRAITALVFDRPEPKGDR